MRNGYITFRGSKSYSKLPSEASERVVKRALAAVRRDRKGEKKARCTKRKKKCLSKENPWPFSRAKRLRCGELVTLASKLESGRQAGRQALGSSLLRPINKNNAGNSGSNGSRIHYTENCCSRGKGRGRWAEGALLKGRESMKKGPNDMGDAPNTAGRRRGGRVLRVRRGKASRCGDTEDELLMSN